MGFPNSTGNASWRGPNKEKLDSQFLFVGVGRRNKFCENIISVPLPLAFT
ncbi:nitrogen fixation protein NifR [Staphylococcus aureus]|nr:nitrogen fixation protein NifR [Staphylococcus aureus]